MHVHRFNDVPINLDILSSGEIHALRRYANQHLTEALGEVAALNMYEQKPLPEFGEPMTSFADWPDSTRIEPS